MTKPFMGAMSATHIKPDRLENIIKLVEDSNIKEISDDYKEEKELIVKRIADEYGIDISNVPIYNFLPYVAEEKLDGYSYLSFSGRLISKSLSQAKDTKGALIDKTEWIPHLAEVMKKISDLTGCDIHGELHIPGHTSDEVTAILGCTVDKAVALQEDDSNKLHFTWLDIRAVNGKDLINEPYYVRRAILESIYYSHMEDEQYVHIAPVTLSPIDSFNRIVDNSGEGLVFKRTDALYIPSKKPANNWIKCKKRITLDVIILGFNNDGSGKNKDLFKSIQIGLMDSKGRIENVGNVHSGISDLLRKRMYNTRDNYIGRVIEVEAMDMSDKDDKISLRHARLLRFRADKTQDQCTADGLEIHMI